MKKLTKILVVALLVLVSTIALVACNDENTHKGDFTHNIENVDDLKKVSEMLGADYDKGVFELKSDIIVNENWESIGSSVDSSFRGTFNGNNHTITYKIEIPEPAERNVKNALVNEKYFGLFGVIHNAKISNLNLNLIIKVPADATTFYVGGLAGLMSGNNTITNVTIQGSVETTMGNICKFIDEETNWRESEHYEMTGYVGSLAGLIQGSTSLNTISSSAVVKVNAFNAGGTVSGVNDLFVGGIVGSMRTVNLSSLRANTEYGSAKNLTYTGVVSAIGSQVNVGGIFGAAYRINDGEKWFTNSTSVSAQAYKRLRIGGIAGIVDRVNVNKTKVDLDNINAEIFSNSVSRLFNVGGVVGYAANFSNINNAISNVNNIVLSTDINNYTGGLVGMLHYSNISNSVASGDLCYYLSSNIKSIMEIGYVSYEGNMQKNPYYIYSGGIAGRVYGESQIDNVSTNFKAYQGLVGEVANAIEIVIIKEGEGETYDSWFASTVYNAGMTTKKAEGDITDGEQKYKVIHNYKLENLVNGQTNLSFVTDNSRCYKDKSTYSKAEEWYNGIGVEQADTTVYNTLYNTINANINA